MILLLITPVADATDWPMFRGDTTNSGYTSESLTPPLKLAWKAKVDGIVLSSPVVSDGLVYVGSTGKYVYALEENSGKQKWKYKTGGWIKWSPAVANGYVYVSSEDGYVYALDKNTGELKWKKYPRSSSSKPVSSPIVADNLVYVLSKGPSVIDSGVCALDASTGNLIWCKEGAPETLVDGASPAISNGILYVGIDNSLYALDAKNGNLKWAYPIGAPVGMPIISNVAIYVGSGTSLYSIDTNTKKVLWKIDFNKRFVLSLSPSIANNLLHLTMSDNRISIVNTTIGKSSGGCNALGLLFSSPTISNKIAYIGSGQYLEAVNAQNGISKWNYTVGSTLSSSPSIANGRLFIGSDGYVYAFEKSYRTTTTSSPLTSNENLLFEGYSLVFSKLSFEDGDDIVELANLELQKDKVKVDSGTYKQGNIVELGNKGLPIIRCNLNIFRGTQKNLLSLENITIYSESGGHIISDIGTIYLYGVLEQETAYWKLDNGYWLYLSLYPHTDQAILHLQKYDLNNLNIDTAVISVGKDFSLKNDTGITILSGSLEKITEQDGHITAKFIDVVQHSGSRIVSKTISNLTDDELRNIISEKNNVRQPAYNLVWDFSDGYSLYLEQVNVDGIKLWLSFRKDGHEINSKIVTEGEQFSIHKKSDRDVTILSGRLDSISLDPWYVTISDVRLYSESGNLLEYVESFDVHSAIASAEKSIDIAKGISADTSEAESLLQQARDKMWNGEYTLAMSYAKKAEALVFDVDNDGVPNNEDFAPITPNNYVYGGVVFSLISLVVGINTTRKVRLNRRVRIRQEAKDAIASFSGGYGWCKSGKLYSDAKKALDS
ncbi:PQQ-binding-like beta-propeller repeat protein, partial [bacterium]|nr:PQQ-binding-like beta-propeller repeat protein [bacterium]